MSITTYSELKTAVANWTKRTDLASVSGDFVTLAETKLNRRLRCWQQETAFASSSIASGLVARPADLVAFKSLNNNTNCKTPIEQKSLEFVTANSSDGSVPMYYAWETSNIRFNTQSGTVFGVYYSTIDALSDSNTTNWLLTLAPDIYLAAVIAESYYYQLDETRATFWEGRRDQLIEELQVRDKEDRLSGNSLVMRVA